jgi:restriction system protein
VAQAWIVRTGRNDEYEDIAFAQGLVAIGWDRLGDLTSRSSRADLTQLVTSTYQEVSQKTRDAYAAQLYAFRSLMQVGDLVVMLRSNAPELAVGEISGDYEFLLAPSLHVRRVTWLRREVRRSEIGAELLDPPALSAVYRISSNAMLEQLRQLAGQSAQEPAEISPTEAPDVQVPDLALPDSEAPTAPFSAAHRNLSRNLNYARNLTSAGSHLEQLQVNLFEVTDVYRAAWVQAVAALDHWVHQEIRERMLRLSEQPAATKPDGYRKFSLSLGAFEDVQAGKLSLRKALDQEVSTQLAFATYQNPQKIVEGLKHVGNVSDLWQRVAKVLNEQTGVPGGVSGSNVKERLSAIVHRRNKIAHEYDEDPAKPPAKRDIDAASTMQTIEWLDQLAAALVIVLDQE